MFWISWQSIAKLVSFLYMLSIGYAQSRRGARDPPCLRARDARERGKELDKIQEGGLFRAPAFLAKNRGMPSGSFFFARKVLTQVIEDLFRLAA